MSTSTDHECNVSILHWMPQFISFTSHSNGIDSPESSSRSGDCMLYYHTTLSGDCLPTALLSPFTFFHCRSSASFCTYHADLTHGSKAVNLSLTGSLTLHIFKRQNKKHVGSFRWQRTFLGILLYLPRYRPSK